MDSKQFFYLSMLKELLKDVAHVYKNVYTVYGDYYWEIDGNLIGCEPISSDYCIYRNFYDGYVTASTYSLLYNLYTKYNIDERLTLCPVKEEDYKKLKSLRKLKEWCSVSFTNKFLPNTREWSSNTYIFDTRTKRKYSVGSHAKEYPCRIGVYLHE